MALIRDAIDRRDAWNGTWDPEHKEVRHMISVTLTDGSTVLLNVDLIEAVEHGLDTVVVLTSGRRLAVRQGPDELIDAIHASRASVLAAAQEGPRSEHRAEVIQLHPEEGRA